MVVKVQSVPQEYLLVRSSTCHRSRLSSIDRIGDRSLKHLSFGTPLHTCHDKSTACCRSETRFLTSSYLKTTLQRRLTCSACSRCASRLASHLKITACERYVPAWTARFSVFAEVLTWKWRSRHSETLTWLPGQEGSYIRRAWSLHSRCVYHIGILVAVYAEMVGDGCLATCFWLAGCSKTHLPGFVKDFEKLKTAGAEVIVCTSTDNAFALAAWGEQHNASGKASSLHFYQAWRG